MAEAAEVEKTAKRERGADAKSALALLVFLALATCHSSLLFGQRFSHVQGAMVQVTSAWTNSPFTLTLASNPARGDLVVVAFASIGCTNGGPSPVTIKDANGNSYAVISTPATLSQAVTSGLCSGGTVYANLWLGYLLNAPSNASGTINVSWPSGQAMGDIWADEFSAAGGSVTFDASASVSSGTASGTALSSPSIPPSLPNELLYGAAVPPELAPPDGSACPMTAPAAGAALGVWTGGAGGIPPLTNYESGGATEYDLNSSGSTAVSFANQCSGVKYAALVAAFKSKLSFQANPVESSASSDSIAEQAAHFATLSESNTTGDTLARQASYWRGDCISLAWTPPAGAQGKPAYSYNVYRGTSPGNETGPINASPVDAGCTSQANCTYVDYGPQAGAGYYYTVTAVSAGAESPFSSETGAVIPQDTVMEANAANDAISRGWAAIRGATENLLAYDSLTAGSFVPVQPKHAFVVPGRTKAGQAPIHKQPSAAPP
jgi:hypothetical protein